MFRIYDGDEWVADCTGVHDACVYLLGFGHRVEPETEQEHEALLRETQRVPVDGVECPVCHLRLEHCCCPPWEDQLFDAGYEEPDIGM